MAYLAAKFQPTPSVIGYAAFAYTGYSSVLYNLMSSRFIHVLCRVQSIFGLLAEIGNQLALNPVL